MPCRGTIAIDRIISRATTMGAVGLPPSRQGWFASKMLTLVEVSVVVGILAARISHAPGNRAEPPTRGCSPPTGQLFFGEFGYWCSFLRSSTPNLARRTGIGRPMPRFAP